jgi:type IV pilus assembly protein PilM
VGFLSKSEDIIGVDLGSNGIRVVQLRRGLNRPVLVAFGSAQIPPDLAQSDSKLDQQKIADILKKLIKSSHISVKNVATSLPGSAIFSTVVKLPPMSSSELAQAVKYQAEQNIPLKIDDVKIDWQVVRENPTTKELAVMIVAAPKTKVERVMQVFEMADLDVMYLETSSIAVARAISNPANPLIMALDFGGSSTELAIIENGIVSHVRSLPAGGYALTRVIAQNLGLDNAQAEQFKRKFGLSEDKLEGQVNKTMRPIINNITDEIQRSIKFYQEQYGGTVQKIVLTGGSSHLLELVTYLKALLGLEVVFGNAWQNISYQPNVSEQLSQCSAEFACAVGLAMRES